MQKSFIHYWLLFSFFFTKLVIYTKSYTTWSHFRGKWLVTPYRIRKTISLQVLVHIYLSIHDWFVYYNNNHISNKTSNRIIHCIIKKKISIFGSSLYLVGVWSKKKKIMKMKINHEVCVLWSSFRVRNRKWR